MTWKDGHILKASDLQRDEESVGQQVMRMLEPMFAEARAKGLWFRSRYQGMEFTPDELAAEHANGRLRWGPVNWDLFDPRETLAILEKRVEEAQAVAQKELDQWKKRMGIV